MARRKLYFILVPIAILLLVVAWQSVRYWWYHGYSHGMRTGLIRTLAIKGSPLCRYVSGELALIGTPANQPPEIWYFTTDLTSLSGPLMSKLEEAQRSAKQVTLSYRQDKGKWWSCAPTEDYVTGVQ